MGSYNTGNLGMGMGMGANAQAAGMHSNMNISAAAAAGPNPAYTAPIATAPHHCKQAPYSYTSPMGAAAFVLVLYVLLVIILRSAYC